MARRKTTRGLTWSHCGKRFVPPSSSTASACRRIMGGQRSTIEQHPWMVAMMLDSAQACGGSLVAEDWIVTAAHCFDSTLDRLRWRVVAGNDMPSKAVNTTGVSAIWRHPQYKSNIASLESGPCDYDVALVKLEKSVATTPKTVPICLVPRDTPRDLKRDCYVAGWGRRSFGGEQSLALREVQVHMVPRELCNSANSYGGVIHERALCAGPREGGCGPCQFDSGGPLACSEGGLWYMYGIVSYGVGCGVANKFGVYSNMYELTDWVRDTISRHEPNLAQNQNKASLL
ncbi:predicted protein [Nematostella vectensis]|uniref:Peptidase S1 domain-containing protein n=1 Tax=Nematostella vectensis TaxID=45351 RepID=A7RJY0_NEMVE|nr:predicted protein [Nematostella vectensis]|eukprot:XP_001640121.1 predicted protein [Nematostella vectensis]